MAAALDTKPAGRKLRPTNDVYTAILGLAVLALSAAAGVVCYYSWSLYGAIFTSVAP